ncbi:hypothetical protein ACOME3_009881 [Neoechinorhynchus agilis]
MVTSGDEMTESIDSQLIIDDTRIGTPSEDLTEYDTLPCQTTTIEHHEACGLMGKKSDLHKDGGFILAGATTDKSLVASRTTVETRLGKLINEVEISNR